ncbi:MAG: CBS domain-containing protein [Candidatus Thorarchaeota archaeon]|nr:MAG: CBS domain-containing protein [Candidatus Thorarchaeota archaeon]RLI60250.1 MAG: CBS domain-containing protein [Candidatus Thorarchaeota archaeon]
MLLRTIPSTLFDARDSEASVLSTGVNQTMMVKDCMQSDVTFVSVPGTREDVLQVMAESQINGIPVVKKGSKTLVGIVTRTDLLRKADENQLAMLMVRDPETVTPRTDVKTALKIMIEKKYRRLPVVEKDELVGLVSVPDILGATLENDEKVGSKEIAEYVTRTIVAVWEQTPLPLTYMIMEMAGKNGLVVVNDSGGVTGMITVSDFIRLSEVTVEDNVSKTFSGTDSAVEWGWTSQDFLVVTKKLLRLPNVPVEQVMTKNIINFSEITTVAECIRTLRREDIDQAPVLSASGNLMGMIEDRDLLPLALQSLS